MTARSAWLDVYAGLQSVPLMTIHKNKGLEYRCHADILFDLLNAVGTGGNLTTDAHLAAQGRVNVRETTGHNDAAEENRRMAGENVVAVIGAQITELKAKIDAQGARIEAEIKAQTARIDVLQRVHRRSTACDLAAHHSAGRSYLWPAL